MIPSELNPQQVELKLNLDTEVREEEKLLDVSKLALSTLTLTSEPNSPTSLEMPGSSEQKFPDASRLTLSLPAPNSPSSEDSPIFLLPPPSLQTPGSSEQKFPDVSRLALSLPAPNSPSSEDSPIFLLPPPSLQMPGSSEQKFPDISRLALPALTAISEPNSPSSEDSLTLLLPQSPRSKPSISLNSSDDDFSMSAGAGASTSKPPFASASSISPSELMNSSVSEGEAYVQQLRMIFSSPTPDESEEMVLAVGTPVSAEENKLLADCQTAIDRTKSPLDPRILAKIGLQNHQRGTYFINDINPALLQSINQLVADQCFDDKKVDPSIIKWLEDHPAKPKLPDRDLTREQYIKAFGQLNSMNFYLHQKITALSSQGSFDGQTVDPSVVKSLQAHPGVKLPENSALTGQQYLAELKSLNSMNPALRKEIDELTRQGTFSSGGVDPSVPEHLQQSYPEVKLPTIQGLKRGEYLDELLRLNTTTLAVFKPADEVRGMAGHKIYKATQAAQGLEIGKKGIPPKNEIPNEVVVSGLGNLKTRAVQATLWGAFSTENRLITGKTGALMPFIQNASNLLHIRTAGALSESQLSAALSDVQTAQNLAILDLRFGNTDRSEGNLMYSFETGQLYPIDHAMVLSSGFQTSTCFMWMNWAAASEPFTVESLTQIQALNFDEDRKKIQQIYPNYPLENLETMRMTYQILKSGAEKGLTPFQLGWLLKGDLMGSIYEAAKSASRADPEVSFAKFQEILHQFMDRMNQNFAPFAKAKLSEYEEMDSNEKPPFLGWLAQEMEIAGNLFNPLLRE